MSYGKLIAIRDGIDINAEKENNQDMTVTNELLDAKLKATESSFETRFVSIESQINLNTEKVLNEIHKLNATMQKDFNTHLKYYVTTSVGIALAVVATLNFIISQNKPIQPAAQTPAIVINVPNQTPAQELKPPQNHTKK